MSAGSRDCPMELWYPPGHQPDPLLIRYYEKICGARYCARSLESGWTVLRRCPAETFLSTLKKLLGK